MCFACFDTLRAHVAGDRAPRDPAAFAYANHLWCDPPTPPLVHDASSRARTFTSSPLSSSFAASDASSSVSPSSAPRSSSPSPPRDTPPPRPNPRTSPLFVTWETTSPSARDFSSSSSPPRLRGCIGTLTPRRLRGALDEYALLAGVRDARFPPVASLPELRALACKVSLLAGYERAADWRDWDADVHGVTIEFEDPGADDGIRGGAHRPPRSFGATYLPGVIREQGWSKEEAMESLARKAGFEGAVTEDVRRAMRVTRYRSSVARATYAEYEARISPSDAANDATSA